ncbi:MAG: type IV toxin-antitoxin system AbiEi family antitoxin domain-containing protein [Acidobacteriota bacterium]|jgi:predicted transcriptional regulator of viral defense system|nr:type IV toxin-antitoxin system AbiEi family antitoxin domain-containing protein [Acidobacteriota bacterium]
MPATTDRDRVLELARRASGVTPRDLAQAGIHRQALTRLVNEGKIERVARGLYRLASRPITENHGLAVAATAVPKGVVCLLSALQYHGLGTHLPAEVWMALDRRAWRPRLAWPPLRIVRFTGEALTQGVEHHTIEGRAVKIYGVTKTIADCFKYRNKIGLDVALEALREAWHGKRFTMEELDRYAAICRVQRIMQPYLEALTA